MKQNTRDNALKIYKAIQGACGDIFLTRIYAKEKEKDVFRDLALEMEKSLGIARDILAKLTAEQKLN